MPTTLWDFTKDQSFPDCEVGVGGSPLCIRSGVRTEDYEVAGSNQGLLSLTVWERLGGSSRCIRSGVRIGVREVDRWWVRIQVCCTLGFCMLELRPSSR